MEVVVLEAVTLLLPEAQLEPGPEKAFRQFSGSQWVESVSHQPY